MRATFQEEITSLQQRLHSGHAAPEAIPEESESAAMLAEQLSQKEERLRLTATQKDEAERKLRNLEKLILRAEPGGNPSMRASWAPQSMSKGGQVSTAVFACPCSWYHLSNSECSCNTWHAACWTGTTWKLTWREPAGQLCWQRPPAFRHPFALPGLPEHRPRLQGFDRLAGDAQLLEPRLLRLRADAPHVRALPLGTS